MSLIKAKKVTAHTLRHSAAMRLLLSRVDVTVIAPSGNGLSYRYAIA